MKKALLSVLVLAIICLGSGCTSEEAIQGLGNNKNEEHETMPPIDANKGEEEMEIVLMTREEFIKYIEENQDMETVDITAGDLEGIDIDGFIAYGYFSEENVGRGYLRNALESYLDHLESERLSVYLAHEIVSIESTDSEYDEFRARFIVSITDGKIIASGKEIDLIDYYRMSYEDLEGKTMTEYMWVGQTKHFDKFVIRDEDGVSLIQIPWDSSGFGYEGPFFYNKSQKYFLTGNGKLEWGILFTEME